MKKRFILGYGVGFVLAASSAWSGTTDLSYDRDSGGETRATLVVAGSPIPQVNSLAIADTTGYYELFPFGTTARLGDASVSVYAGVEGMRGVRARPRGMAIASYTSGIFCATVIVEFAGNTGNFNKQVLCYKAGSVTYSIVRHSVAGSGVRIDFKSGPYFQLLENRMTIGVTTNF